MIKVLFICHGNICRSPMGEFILKKMVQQHKQDFLIASAATSTEEIGNPVYPPARQKLAQHGISCEGKRAVRLQAADYNKFDYFLCMDKRNVQNALRILGGDPDGKVSLLLSFCGEEKEVADPWYTDDFDTAYSEIKRGCQSFLDAVMQGK